MKINFNTIKEIIDIPVTFLLMACIASGLILFLPNNILDVLSLINFKYKYNMIIGPVFFISSIFLCLKILNIIINTFKHVVIQRLKNKKFLKEAKKYLLTLNEYEKLIIYAIYQTPDNTCLLPINTGIVAKLTYWNIMQPIGGTHTVYGETSDWRVPYMLQPWVYQALQEYPDYFNDIEKYIQ